MEYKPVIRGCDSCELAETNPEVKESCSTGLVVNNGVGFCSTEDEIRGQLREGASITASPGGGVMVRYAENGFLTKGTCAYNPTKIERVLAKVGINTSLLPQENRP